MSAADHPFLPELKKGSGVVIPSVPGLWVAWSEAEPLNKIANGLGGADNVAQHDVSSIPDIWARALLFKSAFDPRNIETHPLRAELVQEWRGLLSLLALNKIHHEGDVRIVRVALADAETQAGRTFARALRLVAPEPIQLAQDGPSYGWDDVFLICYKPTGARTEVALGAFSPATLAYTGAGYSQQFEGNRSKTFYPDGRLRQPSGEDERAYLAAWVKDLMDRVNSRFSSYGAKAIATLLNTWLAELTDPAKGALASVTANVSQETLDVEAASGIDRYEIYKEVLRPLARPAISANESPSDILLQFNRKDRTLVEHVIVASAQTLGSDVKVWDPTRSTNLDGNIAEPGTFFKTNFLGAEGAGDSVNNQALKSAKWIRPEKYFLTETLLVAPLGGPFLPDSEASSNVDGHYVLPFKRSILDYFTPSEIVRDLRPQYKSTDEGVIFSFQLPIGRKGQQDRWIEVRKTFKRRNPASSDGSISEMSPPALYIYPRDLGRYWRRYYVFQHGLEHVDGTPLFRDGKDRTLSFRQREGSNSRITEIKGDDPFPEAIELALKSQGMIRKDVGGPPAGLILLAPEKPLDFDPKPNKGETLDIGIDFGTSNTTVYYVAKDKDKGALTFHFRELLRPLCAEPAGIADILRREFVPNENVQPPISTTLRLPNLALATHPFLDYAIYFPRRDAGRPEYSLPGDVFGDIKFHEDARTAAKALPFLHFLLFVVLVEVARRGSARCEIRYSFPKAFTPAQRSRFMNWCNEVVRSSLLDTKETRVFIDVAGLHSKENEERATSASPPVFPDLRFGLEAVAAGNHFSTTHDAMNNRAICLDVGGGTTDIAIWFERKIHLDASIRLAGRQISELVSSTPLLRERLFQPAAASSLYAEQNDAARFAVGLNLILRQEDASVRRALAEHSHQPEIKWLRKMLALEFGAIVYYCAALFINADATGDEEIRGRALPAIRRAGLGFYWGGNAARLLNWLGLGHFNAGGYEDKFLRGVFRNGIRDAAEEMGPPTDHLPQIPPLEKDLKFEVAAGLPRTDSEDLVKASGEGAGATMAGPNDDDVDVLDESKGAGTAPAVRGQRSTALVLGEDCIVDGRAIGWTEAISVEHLFNNAGRRTLLDSSTGAKLGRFVDIFNALGQKFGLLDTEGERIVLTDADRIQITEKVRGEFVREAGRKEEERVVEPVFILEIKQLLKVLSDRFQAR